MPLDASSCYCLEFPGEQIATIFVALYRKSYQIGYTKKNTEIRNQPYVTRISSHCLFWCFKTEEIAGVYYYS
jgi:hypothetical protein